MPMMTDKNAKTYDTKIKAKERSESERRFQEVMEIIQKFLVETKKDN